MADPKRAKRLQRVLDECLRKRAAGAALEDAEVIASHPELMPELKERLAALKLIEQVGKAVDEDEASSAAPKLHIEGRCPHCQSRWRIKSEYAGRQLRCKKCGGRFAANGSSAAAGSMQGSTPAGPPLSAIPGYVIERELGRGGMGVVYRAREPATKRTVALKVMLEGRHADARQRRRFEREIEIAAALQHPHIARLYASGLHEGHHWFAMEYVKGVRLDEFVAKESAGPRDLLLLFARICHAVNHAHQRGVMHRDLKPGNILVDDHAQPRVLDFGLAKLTDRLSDAEASISMPGEVAGTPAYMSPEQTKGDPSQIDVRSDVYSLGVILYRLLTEQSPYGEQKGIGDLLHAINDVEPPSPRRIRKEIRDEVEAIVLKALRKDPAERYQTAGELARDVEAYLAGEVVAAKRGSGWYALRKTILRYKGPAAVVAVVIVLSVGLGATIFAKTVIEYRDRQRVIKEKEYLAADEALRTELAAVKRRAELAEAELLALKSPPPVYVNAGATGADDGSNWANAHTDLHTALANAPTGSEIWVAAGTYRPVPRGPGDRWATFQLRSGVALYGGFAGSETRRDQRDPTRHAAILSGDLQGNDGPDFANNNENAYHVVTGNSTDQTAILDGFTITGGNSDMSEHGHLTGGDAGGGFHNINGNPILRNCTVTANRATWGGGAWLGPEAGGEFRDCLFKRNYGRLNGGAMDIHRARPTIVNCRFIANRTGPRMFDYDDSAQGGGVWINQESVVQLINSTFVGNKSRDGGGLGLGAGSAATLANCLFTGNHATSRGGAVFSGGVYDHAEMSSSGDDSHATLINCTLNGNHASDRGGGVYCTNGKIILANSILWNNSDATDSVQAAQATAESGIASVSYSCVQGWTGRLGGTRNLGRDPLFVNANGPDGILGTEDDDLRLRAGSPCLNAGQPDGLGAGFCNAAAWAAYDPKAVGDELSTDSYLGAVYDGRHVYFVPCDYPDEKRPNPEVLRYDTQQGFTDPIAWEVFNPESHGIAKSQGYLSGASDGRYVYFAARQSESVANPVLIYDTTRPFSVDAAWAAFDPFEHSLILKQQGFWGAVHMGDYVYFGSYFGKPSPVPGHSPACLRHDTRAAPTDPASWQAYVPGGDGIGSAREYWAGATDGRYVYFTPGSDDIAGTQEHRSEILRLDTKGHFTNASSWTTFDAFAQKVNDRPHKYIGAAFDGRFIYFVPSGYVRASGGRTIPSCAVLRYDTHSPFNDVSSWSVYNPGQLGICRHPGGYGGGMYDGRFVYFVPSWNRESPHGEVLRYDTEGEFSDPLSWHAYDASANGVGARGLGYAHAAFDQRYVYFAPWAKTGDVPHGQVLRYDTSITTMLPADIADLDADGDTSEPTPIDLAGKPRVFNKTVDMGAYEFQSRAAGTWFPVREPPPPAIEVDGKPFFVISARQAEPHDFAELADAGFNTVSYTYREQAREYLDSAQRHRLHAVVYAGTPIDQPCDWDVCERDIHALRNHPALLAWGLPVCPIWHKRSVQEMELAAQVVHRADQAHPAWLLETPVTGTWSQFVSLIRLCDIVAVEPHPYWAGGICTSGLNLRDPIMAVPHWTKQARLAAGRDKPVWVLLQGHMGNGMRPSRAQLRATAYLAVNHGATAVEVDGYKRRLWEEDGVQNAPGLGDPQLADLREEAVRVAGELRQLSQAILAGQLVNVVRMASPVDTIDLAAYGDGEHVYIVAVNTSAAPGKHGFEVPDVLGPAIDVLGESRTLRHVDGRFADMYEPYDTHVYVMHAQVQGAAEWQRLFNGRNLSGWVCSAGSWSVEDGVLTTSGDSYIWTEQSYDDFVLELEFKLAGDANSGVFFRTADINDPVQTGIEMQVLGSAVKPYNDRAMCGAIFDCLAPSKNVVRKSEQWNQVRIACDAARVHIVMNGEQIIDMNLDDWTIAGMNPDGTSNKFRTAYKDMARVGHIGLQSYGTPDSDLKTPVWYRNIRIKRLVD